MHDDTPRVAAAKKAAQAAAAGVARATRSKDVVALAAARQELAYRKARRALLEQLDTPTGIGYDERQELAALLED